MRRKTPAFFLVLGVVALGAGVLSLYSVQPGEQAVVTRGQEVVRVAEPGLQMRVPLLERVHTYPVLWERRAVLAGAYTLANCPAEVAVIYRIGDVVAFHEGGGVDTGYPATQSAVDAALSGIAADDPAPVEAARDALAEMLRPLGAPALFLNRVEVDLGTCGPQAPRIEVVEVPMPPLAAGIDRGTFRSAPVEVAVLTSDRRRVEIVGASAPFDITDEDRFVQCFGSGERGRQTAATRLSQLVEHTLRAEAQEVALDGFGDAMASRLARRTDFAEALTAPCGFVVFGIDMGGAQLTQLLDVNCDETPDADVCRPQPGLRALQP